MTAQQGEVTIEAKDSCMLIEKIYDANAPRTPNL